MRRQALDIFVNRVASHPELRLSDDLRLFLQADEETMERARAQEMGIFMKKPADLMQIFKDVQSKVSDVVLGKEKPVEESTSEYEKMKNYIYELEDHLAEAQKHAYRLVKRHRGIDGNTVLSSQCRISERRMRLLAEIEEVQQTRALQRASRKRRGGLDGQGLATVVVVGYTNATFCDRRSKSEKRGSTFWEDSASK